MSTLYSGRIILLVVLVVVTALFAFAFRTED
jgi:hypothetical protein